MVAVRIIIITIISTTQPRFSTGVKKRKEKKLQTTKHGHLSDYFSTVSTRKEKIKYEFKISNLFLLGVCRKVLLLCAHTNSTSTDRQVYLRPSSLFSNQESLGGLNSLWILNINFRSEKEKEKKNSPTAFIYKNQSSPERTEQKRAKKKFSLYILKKKRNCQSTNYSIDY